LLGLDPKWVHVKQFHSRLRRRYKHRFWPGATRSFTLPVEASSEGARLLPNGNIVAITVAFEAGVYHVAELTYAHMVVRGTDARNVVVYQFASMVERDSSANRVEGAPSALMVGERIVAMIAGVCRRPRFKDLSF